MNEVISPLFSEEIDFLNTGGTYRFLPGLGPKAGHMFIMVRGMTLLTEATGTATAPLQIKIGQNANKDDVIQIVSQTIANMNTLFIPATKPINCLTLTGPSITLQGSFDNESIITVMSSPGCTTCKGRVVAFGYWCPTIP